VRKLKDYSKQEFFRIKPLDHFLIEVCNDALQFGFCKWKPRLYDRFIKDAEHLKGKDIGLVVAYEQPWALDWLIRMAARNLKGTLLVFDNSRSAEARVEIEKVCRGFGVPYLGLPPSPTKHPNRSHGMAMTYIFHNVVRVIQPKSFTFIDHDLIPMEEIELGGSLLDQPFYGLPNDSKWAWSLWAGYCAYDFSAVGKLPLNFLNDFSIGLDTGGRNWRPLYRKYDRWGLRFGTWHLAQIEDPLNGTPRPVDVIDGNWIHIGGAGYSSKFKETLDFYERLATAAEEGATLRMLTSGG